MPEQNPGPTAHSFTGLDPLTPARCRDLVEWWDTGVCPNGPLREFGEAVIASGKYDENTGAPKAGELKLISDLVRWAARHDAVTPLPAAANMPTQAMKDAGARAIQREAHDLIADGHYTQAADVIYQAMAMAMAVAVARLEPAAPAPATDAMIKAGVDFALNVSLGGGYRWPDYIRDLHAVMEAKR